MMATPAIQAAEHTRKRQFQPSIDSFFQRNGTTSAGSGSPSRVTSPLSPPIPAETQSSLLSVGMRVRKSVPEGYKTHKTMPAAGFPFPSTAPVSESKPVRPTYSTTSSRELAPFCGLHKVGGFDAPPSSAPAAFQSESDVNGSMPALSMSQSTLSSTQDSTVSAIPNAKATNKRSYDEHIEEDLDAYFDDVEAHEQLASSAPRRIAKLKGSPRKADRGTGVMFAFGGGQEGDFEEATFLVPMETDA